VIGLYEIIGRGSSPPLDQSPRSGAPPPGGPGEEPTAGAANDPAKTPSGWSTGELRPPPPLPSLPHRWVLEIQKIVFHLAESAPADVECPTILFSGVQRKVGTTTVSYIAAHQLAVEYGNLKVLYIDCRLDEAGTEESGKHGTVIKVGDPIDPEWFEAGASTLRRVSIRLGDGRSAAVARWFREFIGSARQAHRAIIIDAPPFFAAPETFSLAKTSDGVVLILRAGISRHPAVNALVSDLDQLGIPVLGTVLNYRQYPIPQWLLRFT
jgi:hypothetical protein